MYLPAYFGVPEVVTAFKCLKALRTDAETHTAAFLSIRAPIFYAFDWE